MTQESLLTAQPQAAGGVQQDADAGAPAAGAGDVVVDTAAESGNGEGEQTASKGSEVPEKYEFALPEGFELDAEIGEEFQAFAKDLKLTGEQAQKNVDFGVKLIQKYDTAKAAAFEAQREAWRTEIKSDKELGGSALPENLGYAARVFDQFAPELRELFASTGFGDHPVVFKAFVRIGKAISEDRLVGGAHQSPGELSPEAVLYPSMKR